MRSLVLRNALLGAITLCGVGLLEAVPAQAEIFNLTSDHCTGGCGTAPFGTVTVTQSGANVDITVALTTGYSFVNTGAADNQNFKFNAVDVALEDITVDAHTPALAAQTGAFNGDGTGNFSFGITCNFGATACKDGGAGAFTDSISFHIADATIADVTQPNNLGNIFVADVLAPNGNTGPVDVSVPGPVVGAGLPGLVLACGGLLALARRRRRQLV